MDCNNYKCIYCKSSLESPPYRSGRVCMSRCPQELCCQGLYDPGMVTQGKQVMGEGPGKVWLEDHCEEEQNWVQVPLARASPPGARPGGGACRQVPGGRAYAHGVQLGPAWTRDVSTPSNGSTTCRSGRSGRVKYELGGRRRRGTSAVQFPAAASSSRDVERHLSVGEGAGACA